MIDGYIGVGRGAGVGIGDSDAAVRLTADFVRRLAGRPLRIEERVVFIAVTVRPAIDRNGFDVARRIETTSTQAAGKLIADISFENFEGRYEKFHAAGFVLLASGKARFAWGSTHMEEDGFVS